MELTKAEMIKKEEEKKKKAEEKKLKEEEKQKRKEERAKKVEEKKLKKEQKNKSKEVKSVTDDIEKNDEEEIQEKVVDEWAVNHYGGKDRDIVNEDGDVIPNPDQMHIPQELIVEPERKNKKWPKKDDDWELFIPFPEDDN